LSKSSSKDSQGSHWIRLFLSIIRGAYLGESFRYGKRTFKLRPRLVAPSDFYRRIAVPSNSYESLLNALDHKFKHVASTEVYRVRKGWVAQGIKGHSGMKIRRVKVENEIFLLPLLTEQRSVGIDTSRIDPKTTLLTICFIPDTEAAYSYLEKHLELPRTHNHKEYKWSKLNPSYRAKVLEKWQLLLAISCDAAIAIETDTLISPPDKLENIFKNLIEGCFSGYENDPKQKNLRPALRRKLLSLANKIPIHCDADLSPLTPDKTVRLLVQTLARRNQSTFEEYTPSFAILKSHESRPIQVTDIIVGILRTKIQSKASLHPFTTLPFDKRKIKKYKGRYAKVYYWTV
jgi:hypothetical protein